MGSKSEALAKQFEAKALTTLEGLGAEDWKKTTAAEKWSVGVTAHHLATALGPISGMIRAVAAGQSLPGFDLAKLDEMNAQHARDHADCTNAETTELHRKGVAMAAETIRGLSDEQLEHFGSIRRTVGLPDGGKGR